MVCLDTSVLIDIIRGKFIPENIKLIFESEASICIASPSLMELVRGLYLERNVKNILKDEPAKIKDILSSFEVLGLEKESAVLAGQIEAELENKGEIIDIEDIMIGAIARHNNETLITRNKKHFDKIKGLNVLGY